MERSRKSFLIYIMFCVISLLINIFVQHLVQLFFNILNINVLHSDFIKNIDLVLIIKMLISTFVSFSFKFLVDKYIVFISDYQYDKKNHQMILLYTFFSSITTILFWVCEILAKNLLNNEYIGIVIGLSLGYTIKYNLDRNFVFNIKNKSKCNVFFREVINGNESFSEE